MTKGILIGADIQVAAWAYNTTGRFPIAVNRAIGILDDGVLAGAALFTNYNSVDCSLSYYGENTLTSGIVRVLARIALYELNLARCTVIVPKRPSYLLKKLPKFGFRYEGVQRRYYGPTDAPRHTGCRFVLFREDMERLAAVHIEKVA